MMSAGYDNIGEYWRNSYEDEAASEANGILTRFEEEVDNLWAQVRPLYELLHAYARYRLKSYYKGFDKYFPNSGHIPIHITCKYNTHTLYHKCLNTVHCSMNSKCKYCTVFIALLE